MEFIERGLNGLGWVKSFFLHGIGVNLGRGTRFCFGSGD